MTPTAEQIRKAQEAGNRAWDMSYWALADERDCSAAYRAAYDATLAALTAAAHEAGVTAEWLTPDEVAMLEARTDETERAEDYDSATEGAWK